MTEILFVRAPRKTMKDNQQGGLLVGSLEEFKLIVREIVSPRRKIPVATRRHSGRGNDNVDGKLARVWRVVGVENATFIVDWYVLKL
jgi:hypothetical protein